MSDVASVIRNFVSYEEILSPQFLCPVCGVIVCAVIVFCIGVGFKSSSEPKFENAGEGDGVPFIKKKKKLKAATPSSPSAKKASTSSVVKTSKKREDTAPEKPSQPLKFDSKEKDTYEPVVVASNDDWITPVTRKEKKARRRHELTPEKDTEVLVQPEGDVVDSRKTAVATSVESSKRVEAVKTVEATKPEPPAPQREKKGRAAKADASAKVTEPPAVEVKVKPVEKSKSEKEDDTKSKKSAKQKAKAVEVPEEPAAAPTPAASTRSKKKKGGASEAPAAAASGGFPLADFELPSSVVVPAAAPQRKTPSPPSTDSSFELVDADAVREAIEAEHQEPSKTSGASRRKTKKPAKSSLPAKVEEEAVPVPVPVPVPEAPKRAPAAAPKAEPEKAAASSNLNFDELGGSIDDWQDAKPSRKRRRARRDD